MAAPSTWRAAALRAVNRALTPLGLFVRTYEQETAALDAFWALQDTCRRALHDATRALRKTERLRRHLLELDALVVGQSPEMRAARRVLDVALGRDTERAA